MAKAIMVQGTMSNAGKSLLAAGLCRIFKQDGYRVAPFKSQNMALNSFITEDGLEMGRAQVMQAEAAGIRPSVLMNPILLKPTNDVGSQVIVNGEVLGTMSARDYFKYKKTLVPDVMKAYNALAAENDIIVIEGAGSPAEINLKDEDIVNMGMAKMAKAPVLLVGDIDRGGVFAQLIGTVELLEDDEKVLHEVLRLLWITFLPLYAAVFLFHRKRSPPGFPLWCRLSAAPASDCEMLPVSSRPIHTSLGMISLLFYEKSIRNRPSRPNGSCPCIRYSGTCFPPHPFLPFP